MKSVFMVLLSLVLLTGMFLTSGIPTAHATVEDGWPAGVPNTPRNPDDVFLDFETGIDGIEIESTIPSIEFTTTFGLNWSYADIRTDEYNVYPYGTQAYETNGNFFAWLGITGDTGRIDFVGGGATYCSALVSTSSGLTLDAYNSEDTLIATSGWADSNINTRTFTRLTVDAPAGETISYVMIHDTGNYWLIDDLCTDANKAVIPVPGRSIGSHSERFDLIFVPDEDYGLPADIDTWLPDFIDDIQDQIDDRLDAAAPVTGNLDRFNFYYTKMQGDSVYPNHNLPADLTRLAPFADAYCILHTSTFGDWTLWGPPVAFGGEGAVGRSFIHEAGHGIFGLADEYDDALACNTARFEPDPMPNVWDTEADGRADATSEGWDPDDIWEFTTCKGDWWKLGTTFYIMKDGNNFANGWGRPASRRIQWVLDEIPATGGGGAPSPEAEKSIWLNLQVAGGVFSLLDESYLVDSPPNYLPGEYDFTAKVFSTIGGLVGEYGIKDPRIVQAESGYEGPTWRDTANFQLILPYFEYGGSIDLIESATGSVMMSVDISQYATAANVPPIADAGPDQVVEQTYFQGADITLDGAGSIDDGLLQPLAYTWTWAGDSATGVSPTVSLPLGLTTVTLSVDDGEYIDTDTVDISVVDTTPPLVDAGDDVIVEQTSYEGAPADLPDPEVLDICDPDPDVVIEGIMDIYPLGSTEVTVTATDESGNTATDTVWVHVVDTTPPEVACLESVNPHGNKIPPAGSTTMPGPKGGQNEDGFYELIALDICDPDPMIFVEDTGSGMWFGPFASGDVIKYTEDPDAVPEMKKMGSDKGKAGAVTKHIIGNGDALVIAVDVSGNAATMMCYVPPVPK